ACKPPVDPVLKPIKAPVGRASLVLEPIKAPVGRASLLLDPLADLDDRRGRRVVPVAFRSCHHLEASAWMRRTRAMNSAGSRSPFMRGPPRNSSCSLLGEQLRHLHSEHVCQLRERADREVLLALLDLSQVRLMHPELLRELLLRKPKLLA